MRTDFLGVGKIPGVGWEKVLGGGGGSALRLVDLTVFPRRMFAPDGGRLWSLRRVHWRTLLVLMGMLPQVQIDQNPVSHILREFEGNAEKQHVTASVLPLNGVCILYFTFRLFFFPSFPLKFLPLNPLSGVIGLFVLGYIAGSVAVGIFIFQPKQSTMSVSFSPFSLSFDLIWDSSLFLCTLSL
jgi:hypothetical protein